MSLAWAKCETSQVLLADGQEVFLGDLPFLPHLTIDSAQKEWNNLEGCKRPTPQKSIVLHECMKLHVFGLESFIKAYKVCGKWIP